MLPRRPSLAIDDRAKPVATLHPRDVRDAAQGPDPHRAALARHLSNSINAEARRWTPRSVALGVALAFGYVLLQVFGAVAGLTRFPMVSPLFLLGGLVGVVLISRADSRRRIGSLLATTAVAEGLCGGCCYSLRELPEEPDGCIVCPECGAAWRARRITRPHWQGGARAKGGPAGLNWFLRFLTLTPPPSQLIAPDDRGRFVSIVDSRLLHVARSRRAELGPDRVRQARRALRRIRRIPRALTAVGPFGIAAVSVYAAIEFWSGREPEVAPFMLIPSAIFLALGIGVLLSHAFYSPRRAARVMVEQSLCPSCARPLDGLPLDADGCAVCPECGGSWRPPTIAP